MRKRSIVTQPAAKLQIVKHKDAMKSISLILLMLLSSMASIQFFAIDASATNTDQDGDGLTYGLEYLINSFPNDPDTDNDGLPDGWEWKYGLNPLSSANDDGAVGDPRKAALQYFTPAGASYVTGQVAETSAAIVRAAYIAQQVVVNSSGYTPSQATTLQVTGLTKVVESTVVADINTLMTLSSNAITAGNINSVPTKLSPQITLNVKTGTYYEILPMYVPRNCAVVGDELRSTNIRPAASVVANGDVAYSLQGIQRLEAIISDVVQNNAVTVTPSGGIITTPTGASLGYQGAGLIEGTGTVNTTASASGTGATFTLTTNAFGFVTGLTVLAPGQNYVVGETITIPSTETINNPSTGDTAIGETITFQVLTVTSGNTDRKSVV